MTECQGCGAWNERCRMLCVLCGTPLAETDEWDAAAELPPLPPLPDGGLSVTMPVWLRAMPGNPAPNEPSSLAFLATTEEEPTASVPVLAGPAGDYADAGAMADSGEPTPVDATPAEQPLGQQADPRTFLRDDDFPRWIRELPALPPRPVPPITVISLSTTAPTALVAPSANPIPLHIPLPAPTPVAQEALQRNVRPAVGSTELAEDTPLLPAGPAAPTDSGARRREAWETPLLAVLVVGVIVAVIWALLVNGLIGSGL